MRWGDHSLLPRPLHSASEIRARENRRFRAAQLQAAPSSVQREVLAQAAARDAAGEHYKIVNGFVRDVGAALADARLAFDAEHRAGVAQALAFAAHHKSIATIEESLEAHGIPVPRASYVSEAAKRRRYRSSSWWAHALARAALRHYEDGARAAALTSRVASPYLSAATLAAYRERCERMAGFLADMEAQNLTTGECVGLDAMAAGSLANPVNRSAELMLKIRGYEAFAGLIGFSWAFSVVTCPSAYHRTLADGTVNRQWKGHTVRDGQAYHRRAWARVRARAKRRRVAYYALRTAEPHADGTAHWNLLIFACQEDLQLLASFIREAWHIEAHDEPGAARHRVRTVYADSTKGSAAGYVAKYITKGTSGEHLEGDTESDLPDSQAAVRVTAWARIHGIRQFQFIGALRAAPWRELRRFMTAYLRADAAVPDTGVPEINRCLSTVQAPADYAAFLEAQGYSPGVRDKALCCDYKAARYRVMYTAGRYAIGRLQTRWGEDRPDTIMGLQGMRTGKKLKTRTDSWRIAHRPTELCKAQGEVSGSEGIFGPWTCSSNCNSWTDVQSWLSFNANRPTGPPDITIHTGIYLDGVEICMTKPADPPQPLPDDVPLVALYTAKLAKARAQAVLGEISDEALAQAQDKLELAKKYELVNEGLRILGKPEHSRDHLLYSIETIGTPDPELGW